MSVLYQDGKKVTKDFIYHHSETTIEFQTDSHPSFEQLQKSELTQRREKKDIKIPLVQKATEPRTKSTIQEDLIKKEEKNYLIPKENLTIRKRKENQSKKVQDLIKGKKILFTEISFKDQKTITIKIDGYALSVSSNHACNFVLKLNGEDIIIARKKVKVLKDEKKNATKEQDPLNFQELLQRFEKEFKEFDQKEFDQIFQQVWNVEKNSLFTQDSQERFWSIIMRPVSGFYHRFVQGYNRIQNDVNFLIYQKILEKLLKANSNLRSMEYNPNQDLLELRETEEDLLEEILTRGNGELTFDAIEEINENISKIQVDDDSAIFGTAMKNYVQGEIFLNSNLENPLTQNEEKEEKGKDEPYFTSEILINDINETPSSILNYDTPYVQEDLINWEIDSEENSPPKKQKLDFDKEEEEYEENLY